MSILRSSVIVSSLTLVSRFFGFIRDVLLADKLGTSIASDAFFVAMILPNLLRRLFGEGAFNVAFVPILSAISENKGKEYAEKFAASAYTILAIILIIITIIAEIFMSEFITHILARGWDNSPEKLELAVTLGRITFPYLILITFASLAGGICNTYGKFAPFAITPVLLNLSFILGLLTLPLLGVKPAIAAAISMTFGGILQTAYMFNALRNMNFKLKLTRNIKHEKIKILLKRLGPAALAIGILQISFMIDIALASYLEGNAVSYLQFANRFYQQPLSLIGIALATVLLPHLSKALKKHDKTNANHAFSEALSGGFLLSLFSTAILAILAFPIINTLFGHGAFNAKSSMLVANALQAYCLALPAFVITKITVTCFYAQGDTKTPLIISAITLIMNVTLNLILMKFYGYIGIALATSISGWFNAIAQIFFIKKQGFISIHKVKEFKIKIAKAIFTGAISALIILIIQNIIPYNENDNTLVNIIWLSFVILSAVISFILCAHFLKLFNLKAISKIVFKK